MPEIKNRMPANCRGVAYCNPIFMPTNAVDHKKQAIMAKKVVCEKSFGITINFDAKVGKQSAFSEFIGFCFLILPPNGIKTDVVNE